MMMKLWLLALPLALNVAAIRVPVTSPETETTAKPDDSQHSDSQPKPSTTDSYSVQDEQPDLTDDKDGVLAPIRYLLPPREDASVFAYPPETQDDWTPMVQHLPKSSGGKQFSKESDKPDEPSPQQELPEETVKHWFNPDLVDTSIDEPKSEEVDERYQEPSRYLLPPLEDSEPSVNFDMSVPSTELKPPMHKPNVLFRNVKRLTPIMPTISLEMQPPSPSPKYKNPTGLYPKKYSKHNAYKPIAIPMQEYQDFAEVPKAKPVKYAKPPIAEDYVDSLENEKKILKYQHQQEKTMFQDEEDARKQQEFVDSTVQEVFASPDTTGEQDASETGHGKVAGDDLERSGRKSEAEPTGPNERTEFRMHGLQGPNSYKFGYDTGKGKNRQFRYEERSNDGRVRGHYGYVDRQGKTQVVNYDAHPELGFHAEAAPPK